MRASFLVAIALAVAAGTAPAYGLPFWHKHNSSPTAHVQSQPVPVSEQDNLIAQATRPVPGSAPQPRLKGPGPHQGDWLRQFSNLPPAQQEQKLQNDPMFRSLTPEKQQHLLDRLRNFNSLSPDKKQKILNRMETYEHLPPEKQAQAQTLFRQYQGLPADQRGQVSQAYRQLRQMSPEQRTQFFNSDEFHNNYNDQQRDLLRGMSDLYPSPVH
jgi:uncharacterized protein DUF3106